MWFVWTSHFPCESVVGVSDLVWRAVSVWQRLGEMVERGLLVATLYFIRTPMGYFSFPQDAP